MPPIMPALLHRLTPRRMSVPVLCVAMVVPIAGCGDEPGGSELGGSEYGADVQDITEGDGDGFYAGPYGSDVAEDLRSFVGEEVVLTADVAQVIGPSAFTITAPGRATAEPLLVVGATGNDLAEGSGVEVTGTVRRGFVVTDVEEALGLELEDARFRPYAAGHYLEADAVEPHPVPAG